MDELNGDESGMNQVFRPRLVPLYFDQQEWDRMGTHGKAVENAMAICQSRWFTYWTLAFSKAAC